STGREPDGGAWALFDGLDPYTGALEPNATGCFPSPGDANTCHPAAAEAVTWGGVKGIYRWRESMRRRETIAKPPTPGRVGSHDACPPPRIRRAGRVPRKPCHARLHGLPEAARSCARKPI